MRSKISDRRYIWIKIIVIKFRSRDEISQFNISFRVNMGMDIEEDCRSIDGVFGSVYVIVPFLPSSNYKIDQKDK